MRLTLCVFTGLAAGKESARNRQVSSRANESVWPKPWPSCIEGGSEDFSIISFDDYYNDYYADYYGQFDWSTPNFTTYHASDGRSGRIAQGPYDNFIRCQEWYHH